MVPDQSFSIADEKHLYHFFRFVFQNKDLISDLSKNKVNISADFSFTQQTGFYFCIRKLFKQRSTLDSTAKYVSMIHLHH